jgi:tetratricopeptide (TPR) repeat protein
MHRPLRIVTVAVLFAIASWSTPASACIWSYGIDLRGKKVQVEGLDGVDLEAALLDEKSHINWTEERRVYAARAAASSDYRVRNDYAVTLLHVGETDQAVRILRQLEKAAPRMYVTAVNLGTALEVAGQNGEALRWIREGIRRNSRAHGGTEWLHARILEAKLALTHDPRWLQVHSVLGVDFGPATVPRRPRNWPPDNSGRPATVEGVQNAIFYQLHERLQFVKPPDAVVANLFFDAGNIAMLTGTLETAQALYKHSVRFGSGNAALVQERLRHVEYLLRKYHSKQK